MVRHEPRCLTKWRHPSYVWSSDIGISDSDAVRDAARQINQANQIVKRMRLRSQNLVVSQASSQIHHN